MGWDDKDFIENVLSSGYLDYSSKFLNFETKLIFSFVLVKYLFSILKIWNESVVSSLGSWIVCTISLIL